MIDTSRPPSFDFGAATLQGFNLPGGKSYLIRVAAWTALLVTLIYVALGTPVVKAYAEFFRNIIEMEHSLDGSDPEPEVFFAMLGPMMRAMGFISLIALLQMIVFASAETAIYRNLFHAEDTGIFPLRLGSDEWRVFGTRIVVGFILGGVYLALYIVAAIIGLSVMGLAGALDSSILAALGGLIIFFLIVAAIAGFVWIAVRLAPSSAYSVRDRVFNPVASWNPMNGRVWPAIGCFLILYLIGYFIISLIVGVIFMIVFFSSGILKVLMAMESDVDSMPDFAPVWDHVTSAGFLIPVVLAILVSSFISMLWYGMIWSMWGYFAKTDQVS